jgi:hypothetical protein
MSEVTNIADARNAREALDDKVYVACVSALLSAKAEIDEKLDIDVVFDAVRKAIIERHGVGACIDDIEIEAGIVVWNAVEQLFRPEEPPEASESA